MKMKKQLAVVMSAAVLSVGGWAWAGVGATAHAATGTYQAVLASQDEATAGQGAVTYTDVFVSEWLSGLPHRVAGLYDVQDENLFNTELSDGSSIADAAGVSYTTIISSLTSLFAKDAAYEVTTGNLTDAEAAQAAKLVNDQLPGLLTGVWTGFDTVADGLNPGREVLNNRISRLVEDTSGLSDLSSADLRAALLEGKSLAEAADLDADTLTASLVSGLSQDLDRLVRTNRLTDAEGSALKSEAAATIAQLVNTKGYETQENDWMDAYAQSLIDGKLGNVVSLSVIYSEEDYTDVREALAGGATLANAVGKDADALVSLLQKDTNNALDSAWRSGALTSEKADYWKAEAVKQLQAAVTKGYGTAAEANTAIVEESLRSIVSQTASYAGITLSGLRTQLDSGSTLADAADLSANELAAVLKISVDAYIDQTAANGWLSSDAVASTKTAAYNELLAAVDKVGYTGNVDAEAYLKERADRLVDDTAAVTDIPASSILQGLAQGRSLAEAANTDTATLYKSLIKAASKEVNVWLASGSITGRDADTVKAQYAQQLMNELETTK